MRPFREAGKVISLSQKCKIIANICEHCGSLVRLISRDRPILGESSSWGDRGQLNSFSFLRGYQDDMATGRLVKSDAVFLAYIANLVVEAIIDYLKLCRREKQTKAILSMVGSGVDTVIRCWAERSFTSTETPSSTRWSVMQVQSSSVSTSQVGESNGAHRKALVQRNLWMTSLMSRKAAVEVCNVTHVRNLDIHSFERIINFPCHCVKLNGARWDTIFVSWRLE